MEINDKIEYLCQIAYSTRATILNTYALAVEMMTVPGCFIECGVGAGAQLIAMKLACLHGGKVIYGFDSFEGIPLAGVNDETQPGLSTIDHNKSLPISQRLVSSGVTSYTRDQVLNNFMEAGVSANNVNLVQGWFQNTVPGYNIGQISLLRLDGDLYESTMVCLQELYPKVSVGGVVIIDDYGLKGCRKAVHEYFGVQRPQFIDVKDSGGVVYFYKI